MAGVRPDRVVVVGTSGAGKSTFAAKAGQILGAPHVELDALHWEADWQETPAEEMRARVSDAVAGPRWVVDGNYAMVRDLVWPRAEALVWLDLSLGRCLWQVVRRTIRRALTREVLWGNNREPVLRNLLTRESIIWWTLSTHASRRREYEAALADSAWAGLPVHRLRTPSEVAALLATWAG